MFDLKYLRERAGLTQAQLAKRLNTNQVQVCRYETTPGNVPMSMIQAYLAALGLDLVTEIAKVSNSSTTPIDINHPYRTIQRRLQPAIHYLESVNQRLKPESIALFYPDELLNAIQKVIKKPRLLITGNFDAGKSHLANYLLGKRCLPTGYQPETRAPIYVRHTHDRPSFIHEDVWIMKEGFNADLWAEKSHVETHKIVAGNFSTLNEWLAHSGQFSHETIGAALIFVESRLLEGCELIDVPGNLHSKVDHSLSDTPLFNADIVLYASSAKGFLNGNDLIQLQSIQQQLQISRGLYQETSQLLIIATHADPSINDQALKEIITRGTKRLQEELISTPNDLSDKLFTFWEENSERNQDLLAYLQTTLATDIPNSIEHHLDVLITNFIQDASQYCNQQINNYQISLKAKNTVITQEIDMTFKRNEREKIKSQITLYQQSSQQLVAEIIDSILTIKQVEKIIIERYPDREQAKQFSVAHITNQIQMRINEKVQQHTTELMGLLQHFSRQFEPKLSIQEENTQFRPIPINTQGLLLGGVAGLAGVGPFAAWASQLGPWGGYLVFVEGASTLGMSTAGAAGVVSSVVAIGGPAVLAAIVIASGAALGVSLLGKNWQHRLAEQIIHSIRKSELEDRLSSACQQYWEQVNLEFEENNQLNEKKQLTNDKGVFSEQHRLNKIDEAQACFGWIKQIPW